MSYGNSATLTDAALPDEEGSTGLETIFLGPGGERSFRITETRLEAVACLHSLVAPG